MVVEIERVTARRRSGGDTAAAELWVAYLHLMKAKGAVRDQATVDELQRLMDAALDAFRRHQLNSAQSPQEAAPGP